MVNEIRAKWPGYEYDLLNHNCCHFCLALCAALQKDLDKKVPNWLNRFAYGADRTIVNTTWAYN